MSDKPIGFLAPMVRAVLREIENPGAGKTVTRRVLEMPPMTFDAVFNDDGVWHVGDALTGHRYAKLNVRYRVGDRLWVREAWHAARSLNSTPPRDIPRDADIEHAATARNYAEIGLVGKLRPGMFLPRWASRITLIVTDVRVQRVQEIIEEDAIAEGAERIGVKYIARGDPSFDDGPNFWHFALDGCSLNAPTPVEAFRLLWDGLYAERGHGWDENPWVCAISFRPVLGNIDSLGGDRGELD